MPTTRYDASRRECPTSGHAHAGADPQPAGWRAFVAELLPRVFAASALSYFAYAALLQWRMHPARITLIVTVLAASLTVGLSLFARVWFKAQDAETTNGFIEAIKAMPQVVECHVMAGECDALLRIVTEDLASYRRFHADHLTRIPGVQSVKTEVPMETVKLTHALPL